LNQTFFNFLASGITAAIVSALFTKAINDKNQKLKYVTRERQNWRKEIREKTVKLVKLVYSSPINIEEIKLIKAFFLTRLNPTDEFDLSIIRSVQEISKANIDDFVLKVACLLKYDWERVKMETRRTPRAINFIGVVFLTIMGFNFYYYFSSYITDLIENNLPENLRVVVISVVFVSVFLFLLSVLFYILQKIWGALVKKIPVSWQRYLDAPVSSQRYYEEVTNENKGK
jgi:hypothetical protein